MCDSPLGAIDSSSILQLQPLVHNFFADIKYYFLNNPMVCYEYIKIPLLWFPQDIIDQYKIMGLVDKNSFVYVNIHKGAYGLKRATCINFDRLVKLLKPHGYYPLRSNPGIWCHETLPTKFLLCVDDFGIKYTNTSHAHHLVDTLKNTTQYPLIGEGVITVSLL